LPDTAKTTNPKEEEMMLDIEEASLMYDVWLDATVIPQLDVWKTINLSTEEVKVVKLTAEQLGFKDGASIQDIYYRAIELGLELCPPELGPQIVRQCSVGDVKSCLHIGMDILPYSNSMVHHIEHVKGRDDLLLNKHPGHEDYFCEGWFTFAFVKP